MRKYLNVNKGIRNLSRSDIVGTISAVSAAFTIVPRPAIAGRGHK